MTRTDFPDWPSHENPPSQRLPAIQQRWWWQQTSDSEIFIIDEYGFAVASDLDAATARHIIKLHNRKIGAAASPINMTPEIRKRGRPTLDPEKRKRNNVTLRLRDALKKQLIEQAIANGRSLSEEMEYRLEYSTRWQQ